MRPSKPEQKTLIEKPQESASQAEIGGNVLFRRAKRG
jgi:hypothetical protein